MKKGTYLKKDRPHNHPLKKYLLNGYYVTGPDTIPTVNDLVRDHNNNFTVYLK